MIDYHVVEAPDYMLVSSDALGQQEGGREATFFLRLASL